MNTVYISVSLCHFQFLSSVSYIQRSFSSLARLISRYFILFDTIANEIVFLNLFLTIYCQFIEIKKFLYMNFASCNFTEFIEFSRFWQCLQGFSMYSTMSSAKSGSFGSSFPIWMPFIYFSDLSVMSQSFNTV